MGSACAGPEQMISFLLQSRKHRPIRPGANYAKCCTGPTPHRKISSYDLDGLRMVRMCCWIKRYKIGPNLKHTRFSCWRGVASRPTVPRQDRGYPGLAQAALFKLHTVKIGDPEAWKRPVCSGGPNTRVFSRFRDQQF
jgi:hypothetical protein